MSGHFDFDRKLRRGNIFDGSILSFKQGFYGLLDHQKVMQQMLDGDGSQESHFAEIVEQYGFEDTAKAMSAWGELNSLIGKLTTNAPIEDIFAAITQFFAKFG